MVNETKFGLSPDTPEEMTCNEFDVLLADAIDDTLAPDTLQRFRQHAATCGDCGPMFAEVRQGLNWLKTLEEVEPPSNLVHNVLALTSHADSSSAADDKKQKGRWSFLNFGYFPQLIRMHVSGQSGFLTTAGMAFFSISLLLNVAGFSPRDLRHVDLRPSAIRKQAVQQYYAASARFVRYYRNTRLVYEIESKLRELRRAAESDSQTPKPESKPAPDKTFNQPPYDDPAIVRLGNEPQALTRLHEPEDTVRRFA